MNKTISLVAIGMVAVVMGLSAFAPAMATPNENGGHNPKIAICHYDFNLGDWEDDKMVNKHALVAHLAHGDAIIADHTEAHASGDHITVGDCNLLANLS